LERKPVSSLPQAERKPIVLAWRMEDPTEVRQARDKFEEYLRAGWLAFTTDPENRRFQIFKFNPKLEMVILIPFAEGS